MTFGMNSAGTFWIFCLMFIICADVVGRYVFNAPIRGAAEMVGYSIVTAASTVPSVPAATPRAFHTVGVLGPEGKARLSAGQAVRLLLPQTLGAAVAARRSTKRQ